MQSIINIAINDLRVFLKDRGNLIGLLLIPLVMTYIIGAVNGGMFSGGSSQIRVDVIDNDQSDLSAQVLDNLRQANNSLVLCPMDNDTEDICKLDSDEENPVYDTAWAEKRVDDGVSMALIEIPAGFGEKVAAFEPVSITFRYKDSATAVEQALDAVSLRVNGAVVAARVGTDVVTNDMSSVKLADASAFSQALYDEAATIWNTNPITVTFEQSQANDSGSNGSLQEGMGQSVPGMGSMFVMFTVFGGMTILIQERKQGTLQRIAVMPVSKAQIVGGKILGRFILGILQFLVVFLMGVVVGVNFGKDPLALVLILVVYTLAVTAFSFALGSRLANESQASGLSLLLSMVLASLGGAWWPLEVVPQFMRTIGHISPVAWAMDGFNELIFYNGGLSDVLIPIGVLAAMTIVFFLFAITRFKYD